ncbi:MAG: CRTAC1 family protein [Cyclobacteriaceae bacterium]|nr:CRTAC1 family protein [Cyclobacteriaceae bacterium]
MWMKKEYSIIVFVSLFSVLFGCHSNSSNKQMVKYLAEGYKLNQSRANFFYPEGKVAFYDSLMLAAKNDQQKITASYFKGYFLLQAGEPEQSIQVFTDMLKRMDPSDKEAARVVHQYLGVAYLRLGEQLNCIDNRTAESCIFPIQGAGIHQDNAAAKNSVKHFEEALRALPDDLETRWLLNIAYMTLGLYPDSVPTEFLIPGLGNEESTEIKPFQEISTQMGIAETNMSGGVIIEDFNLDGYLDIVTSAWGLDEPMHYWLNNGDGSFTNAAESSGLSVFTGGLNMMQTDYNNDGYPDIYVLRGGWMGKFGRQPNSLLRNNGDNTFTDVTIESGMLSFMPSQTAAWNDFNKDGWLDVFVGNESNQPDLFPCEFYLNQKDGTFKNVAYAAGIDLLDFVKAVTSGDYDNDGWPDIFISTMNHRSYLFRNTGSTSGEMKFEDVTERAGFASQRSKTFPTWFWDYDNDGWLDIFLCGYDFDKSLGYYEAAEKLNLPLREESKMKLFHNNGDGTFTNVAEQIGLASVANTMGSNFGDINNDGYLDFYLGTGNPDSKSIVPNRLYLNEGGKSFKDVSASARVGHLQKGHGVSFADLDYDGEQDIYIQVGGSFKGESNQNCFYLNPGQSDNNWISIKLKGVQSNQLAIGSRIKVTFKEDGVERNVYRDINSGGSFGASPLVAHIGIGKATQIDRIEVLWPLNNLKQEFKNISPNQHIQIVEGNDEFEVLNRSKLQFVKTFAINK